ncbi:ribonuclease HII [bacterium]|nr:MAG: ribonuclease HII [bacterium]
MIIAGVDEAGRGPLAGPVVAAAVIVEQFGFPDSKSISANRREQLYQKILSTAKSISICAIPPYLIDLLNIRKASLLAMRQAILSLDSTPDLILVDGIDEIPNLNIAQKTIVKGDKKEFAIGAASIIAKVARDLLMCSYERLYPNFQYGKHKGYPTREHYNLLKKFGITLLHRKSFRLE